MMEEIQIHDFIEIDYVGRMSGSTHIFDLTDENIAKENNLYDPKRRYGPITICIGENNLLKGIDKNLINKDLGRYKFHITPEEGFGKKDPKLIKLVSLNIFLKQKINPFPGLQVNIDNLMGTIRSVSGGRCIVDFNHPLAGRELEYEVNIIRKIIDQKEKIKSLLNNNLFLDDSIFNIIEDKASFTINIKTSQKMPENVIDEFKRKAKELIKDLKELNFTYDNITTQE